MSGKKDLRIVDATMRDGGLVNDFYFEEDWVRALYQTNLATGVDYMEFGYKASKKMYDPAKNGIWKYCDDEDIRRIVGDNAGGLKIAVMADVGRCDFHEDIHPKKESPIDMIRVATYMNTIPGAVAMIEDAAAKGYEVSCNIMGISQAKEDALKEALRILGGTPAEVLYIVDSYGALFPEHTKRLSELFLEEAARSGKKVGIHAHNNLQMAFSNTVLAHESGASWMDGTYASMGRGAGNCAMELLLGYMEHVGEMKYHFEPSISFVDNYMNALREKGVIWGCDLQYVMTGLLNQHPRRAIQFTKEGRRDQTSFYREVQE